jgi:glycosyltransferase involved in cell wall biosynthesis
MKFAPQLAMTSTPRSATVVICTYNRAMLLRRCLESLAGVSSARPWDVVIVDNNSSDDTRPLVEELALNFPVPLTYLFEPRQGKSFALNTGIAASRGEIIVFTDDDVIVAPVWLDAACGPLEGARVADYTGGPVRPLWETPPPRWVDLTSGELWGTLAILDYGADAFVFEERRKVPIGANLAVDRDLIERIGGFDPELGRKGKSLLGQEQAEFLARSRAAGARGMYVPAMEVHHHVPTVRLSKRYFRRWWFWKGVSRARMDALHPVTEHGIDLRTVPHIAGVPRYMWGEAVRRLTRWAWAAVRERWTDAARHEMGFWYTVGYIRARWGPKPRRSQPIMEQAPPQRAVL